MKRTFTFILSICLLTVMSVSVYAEKLILAPSNSYAPDVNYQQTSLIENDYYKIYHNDLFEHEYEYFKTFDVTQQMRDAAFDSLDMLQEDSCIYISVILKEKNTQDLYNDYITSVLLDIISEGNILYVGNTVPMAVIKITKENIAELRICKDIEYVCDAFFYTNANTNFLLGAFSMGNAISKDKVSAADARYVLRFCAGLEKVSKESAKTFYFVCDMDFDGHITSADARLILRTAAGLEEEVIISFAGATDWNDFR